MINLNDKLYYLFSKFGVHILRTRCQPQDKKPLLDSQIRILELLMKAYPDPMNHSDLAKALFVSKPNITSVVDRLQASGLVRRMQSREDKRISTITITGRGRKTYESASPVFQLFKRRCFITLKRKEKETLIALLEKLVAHAEKNQK